VRRGNRAGTGGGGRELLGLTREPRHAERARGR
jgi:hypothetical protein